MTRKPIRPLVVPLVGATATGKTRLSLELALRHGGEILNMDSLQVYKGLDIGTAKATPEERAQAPHHLVDIVEPPHLMNAADFRRRALAVLEDCARRQVPLVLVAGGTGFYLQALLRGMHPVQSPPEDVKSSVQEDLRSRGLAFLYDELRRGDPEHAARLHATDTYRISRAVEILRSSGGRTVTEIRAQFREEELPWRVRSLGLRRAKPRLRETVALRAREMLERGLLEEVAAFQARGLRDWSPLHSVGYKEAQEFLAGRTDRAGMINAIVHNTMQLAKRQGTWFRRDKSIAWFDSDFSLGPALEWVAELLA